MTNTPDEIKKGLECHGWTLCDKDCPYGGFKGSGYDCSTELCGDALILIQQLESKLNQAVEDIRMLGRTGEFICPVCAYYNHGEGTSGECVKCLTGDGFRWRGEKEEDDEG